MKKIQVIFAMISILTITSITVFAQNSGVGNLKVKEVNNAPDLKIAKYVFVKTNKQALRVYVQNQGNVSAGSNRLLLTIGKIDGISVKRKKVFTVPILESSKGVWLFINAKSLLPNDVAINSTVFKLNVDSTDVVSESIEGNNSVSYEGKPKPQIDGANSFTIKTAKASDLRIRQVKFSGTNDKLMSVQVYNGGNADAPATRFLLAIGEIDGVNVDRKRNFKMPPLAKRDFVWVKIDASSLLPNNISLKSTVFKLMVDMPDIINESNETNNIYYQNIP